MESECPNCGNPINNAECFYCRKGIKDKGGADIDVLTKNSAIEEVKEIIKGIATKAGIISRDGFDFDIEDHSEAMEKINSLISTALEKKRKKIIEDCIEALLASHPDFIDIRMVNKIRRTLTHKLEIPHKDEKGN